MWVYELLIIYILLKLSWVVAFEGEMANCSMKWHLGTYINIEMFQYLAQV